MKEALTLQVGERRIVMEKNFRLCFQELASTFNYPMTPVFVNEGAQIYSDLEEVIGLLNSTRQPREVETSDRDIPSTAPATAQAAAPAEETEVSQVSGSWASLTDDQRAERLRQWIKERILTNDHPTEGCADNEVRVGKIFESWGTGLSRGSISRHAKKVVDELEAGGANIFRGAGRYLLLNRT